MFKLEDGGLYETRSGQRVRITKQGKQWVCPRSFPVGWFEDGQYLGGDSSLDIITRVEEKRWVPVCGGDNALEHMRDGQTYRMHRGHLQRLVTREKAKQLDPNYPQTKVQPATPTKILVPDGKWFTYAIARLDHKIVVNLETSAGAKIVLPF